MTTPRYDDLPVRPDLPPGSAWAVFGERDEVGTLNRIDAETVRTATACVRRGQHLGLDWDIRLPSPPVLGRGRVSRQVVPLDGGGFDDYYDGYHPQASTQWDALSHVEHPAHGFYNGTDLAAVTDPDRPRLGIDAWARRGIVGRFVLVDLAGQAERSGAPIDHTSSRAFGPADLDEALRHQRVARREGDILLLHFGWTSWYESLDEEARVALADAPVFPAPGLDPAEDTARWLWDGGAAAVAADVPALERMPFDKSDDDRFLHNRLIPLLGFAVGELFDLAALTAACRADGQWDGMFVAAPMNSPGGHGSAGNAVAIR